MRLPNPGRYEASKESFCYQDSGPKLQTRVSQTLLFTPGHNEPLKPLQLYLPFPVEPYILVKLPSRCRAKAACASAQDPQVTVPYQKCVLFYWYCQTELMIEEDEASPMLGIRAGFGFLSLKKDS